MRQLKYLRYLPTPVWIFSAGILLGIVIGATFARWLSGILTVLFFVGLVALAVWIWIYLENQKKK